MIAAAGSGQGKTLVTAALARYLVQQGKRVQVIKIGPDYLDPTILECASGCAVLNMDIWMMGQAHCRFLLNRAAKTSDVLLVESMMGLHDNSPSNAELARTFGLPVVLVISAAKYAQTASAIVEGMASFNEGVEIQSVIGNRIASDNHHRIMCESLGSIYAGSIRTNEQLSLPQRHLGLVQAQEVSQLAELLDNAANAITHVMPHLPISEVEFAYSVQPVVEKYLNNKVIAVAKDAAFSFIYPQNISILRELGAAIRYFSPLAGQALPKCDAVWLPGGYPELHMERLSCLDRLKSELSHHIQSSKPLLAECGGMMIATNSITTQTGKEWPAWNLFPAESAMMKRFQSIALQQINYGESADHFLRGHSFHHSVISTSVKPWKYCLKQNSDIGEPVYKIGASVFSYMHHYFPSSPETAAMLFGYQP